jgi:predicted NAD-dependent protein-ADP-ribosyltransferase YbiA (DUF1768 family)
MPVDELLDELERIWGIGSNALDNPDSVADDTIGKMMMAIEELIAKVDNLNATKVIIK